MSSNSEFESLDARSLTVYLNDAVKNMCNETDPTELNKEFNRAKQLLVAIANRCKERIKSTK